MISVRPFLNALAKSLGHLPADLETMAVDRWTVAPSSGRFVPPAVFLPGHLDRMLGAEFGSVDAVARDLQGGFESMEGETLGFRFRNVDLVDGVLYASTATRHLRERVRRSVGYRVPTEILSGSLYESWVGNKWFGSWLMEDCLTYSLAEQFGSPATSAPRLEAGHTPAYERLLGIRPRRVSHVRFEELILFQDGPHNDGKKARADRMRERLVATTVLEEHPGVFLLRGSAGAKRILSNEMAFADRLASSRGFRIVDPLKSSVDEIIRACAGAQVVAGVEGSQLVHGLMSMPPGATLFVVQPPKRVVSTLKIATDRQGQGYAFVIAAGGDDEFTVDIDEAERTLDLIASRQAAVGKQTNA